MRRFKFTTTAPARHLTPPQAGTPQTIVWDAETQGLGAYRGKTGPSTFFVHFRLDGRQRKATLGRVGEVALPNARERAVEILAAARQGRDVAEERAAEHARLTLADAFAAYTEALRRKQASPKMLPLNDHNWRKMLAPHGPRDLRTLTRREVRAWHENWGHIGPTAAN